MEKILHQSLVLDLAYEGVQDEYLRPIFALMADQLSFKDYLTSKKIDPTKFGRAEPDLFRSLKIEFDQMHPNSFTQQKLFLINPIRRKYLLIAESATTTKPKTVARPKFKRSS